jgi:hypothetical protein
MEVVIETYGTVRSGTSSLLPRAYHIQRSKDASISCGDTACNTSLFAERGIDLDLTRIEHHRL